MQTSFGYIKNRDSKIRLTRHARIRSEQRAISSDAIGLIRLFGDQDYDGKGGIRYMMSEKAMLRLYRAVGRTQKSEALKGKYLVISSDEEMSVITVAHRH